MLLNALLHALWSLEQWSLLARLTAILQDGEFGLGALLNALLLILGLGAALHALGTDLGTTLQALLLILSLGAALQALSGKNALLSRLSNTLGAHQAYDHEACAGDSKYSLHFSFSD